ncbi:MAG: hypothetical protein ABL903_18995 [Methylococcales bacterium]
MAELPNQEAIIEATQLLLLLPLQGILFFILFLFSGLRARTAFVSSLALTTYSEFALITTDAMVNAQLLASEWKAVISLAVAGSLAFAAPLNKYSHQLFSMMEPTLSRFEKNPEIQTVYRYRLDWRSGWWLVWVKPAWQPI